VKLAQVITFSGVDVMITIFCDFSQFSAKNGVFLKYQCYDQLFSKFSFVLSQKRQFFAKNFAENILKIITSVPGRNPPWIDPFVVFDVIADVDAAVEVEGREPDAVDTQTLDVVQLLPDA
jgi:hypothetical protein